MGKFNELSTVQFQMKMKPAALAIYQRIFPGSTIEDLREHGVNVHILDKEFGVDALWHLESGQWISIQEKYREHAALSFLDFTIEYKNAVGTYYESKGEWFKLGAQLYFYGWANKDNTGFEKWAILDIPRLKQWIELHGGLEAVGVLNQNKKHGKASFYAIPIQDLEPCFFMDYRQFQDSQYNIFPTETECKSCHKSIKIANSHLTYRPLENMSGYYCDECFYALHPELYQRESDQSQIELL